MALLDSEPSGLTPGCAPGVLADPYTLHIVITHNQNSMIACEVSVLLAVNPAIIVEEVRIDLHSGHDGSSGGDVSFGQVRAVESLVGRDRG